MRGIGLQGQCCGAEGEVEAADPVEDGDLAGGEAATEHAQHLASGEHRLLRAGAGLHGDRAPMMARLRAGVVSDVAVS